MQGLEKNRIDIMSKLGGVLNEKEDLGFDERHEIMMNVSNELAKIIGLKCDDDMKINAMSVEVYKLRGTKRIDIDEWAKICDIDIQKKGTPK